MLCNLFGTVQAQTSTSIKQVQMQGPKMVGKIPSRTFDQTPTTIFIPPIVRPKPQTQFLG